MASELQDRRSIGGQIMSKMLGEGVAIQLNQAASVPTDVTHGRRDAETLAELFTPEIVLPEQFFEGARRDSYISGEKALMLAVLEDGIRCFQEHLRNPRSNPRLLSKQAEEWMVPLQRGEETDLIEIPASWYLDDLPPMMFIKGAPNSHGFVNPRHLEEIWIDQFDWVYREYDYAVFTMTIHPDVSGRPQVLLMHERIIEHINKHDGVRWATFDEIADDFAERSPRRS